jgi:hypothetical protein
MTKIAKRITTPAPLEQIILDDKNSKEGNQSMTCNLPGLTGTPRYLIGK